MRLARAAAALSDLRAAYDAVPRADLAASLGYAYQACGPTGERVSASDWFKMSDQEFLDRYAPAAASRREISTRSLLGVVQPDSRQPPSILRPGGEQVVSRRARAHRNSSNSALASTRSGVSKPSVNQP